MNYDLIINSNFGIGDTLSIFTTSLPCYSASPYFPILRKYSSCKVFRGEGIPLKVEELHGKYPGVHIFNKVRLAVGDEPLKEPKPILDKINYSPIKNRATFSFGVGAVVYLQRATINPKARQLYPEHRELFQKFFLEHPEIDFVEVGKESFGFSGVRSETGVGLDKTIEIMSNAEFHIGIHSGLEHLSTAIGIKTCGLINIPTVEKFGEPNEQEMDWLAPQVYRLHMDGENEKIKRLNRENLERFISYES